MKSFAVRQPERKEMSFARFTQRSVGGFRSKWFQLAPGVGRTSPLFSCLGQSRVFDAVLSRSNGTATDSPQSLSTISGSNSSSNSSPNSSFNSSSNSSSNSSPNSSSNSSTESFDDIGNHIFNALAKDGKVSAKKFFKNMAGTGIRKTDPRLRQTLERLSEQVERAGVNAGESTGFIDRSTFLPAISNNMEIISRSFRNDFIIPDFNEFTQTITKIYEKCKPNAAGKVASYIPQLARVNPNLWAVSVCTIDGQRFSIGDDRVPYTIQSTNKPLSYAVALDERGEQFVHKYVGQEPSGRRFNEISLNTENKPHNPMVNSGAIVTMSLIKPDQPLADRFDFMHQRYSKLAGSEYIGFNNSTFLSERETADKNFALAYFMREKGCFPPSCDLHETLDFYFQMCAMETTCDTSAVIAATFANGGYCPITGDCVINPDAVRDTLSLMYSCGMYDYSGQFAFQAGLPAKSGVSGSILLVVPNVAGFCLYSPCLDVNGNSIRGIQFCEELVSHYNFHNYDNLRYSRRKNDPRQSARALLSSEIVSLLYSAYHGDVSALRRYWIRGINMNLADYDGRTALHLAAAEGNIKCVEFLVEKCNVTLDHRDRWGSTALDGAMRENHTEITDYLSKMAETKKTDPTQKKCPSVDTIQHIQSDRDANAKSEQQEPGGTS